MWGAALGAGLSAGGGFLSGLMNIGQARKARKWAERMRASAYQTTVKDLRLAGLNPLLAYTRGPTATPTGAQARIGKIGEGLGASALSMSKLREELALLRAQTGLVGEQSEKVEAERRNILTDPKKAFFRNLLEGAPSGAEVRKKLELLVEDLPVERHGKFLRKKVGEFGSVLSEQWQSAAKRWRER